MSLHFITGKGGVGKTRLSILIAVQLEKSGHDVLLTEMTEALAEEIIKLGIEKKEICQFSREKLGEEFLKKTLRIPFLSSFISQSKIFQSLFQLAPNLYELLLLHRWMEISKSKELVVDAPSTGHFLGLLESAQAATHLFDGGSLRRLAEEINREFETSSRVKIYTVALPENSALQEATQIEKRARELFPNVEIKTVLNRKHLNPENLAGLSSSLQEIAIKRVQLEQKRLENKHFDFILNEGAKSL
jgi:anion-transporting  ArsA/GET3 family ATPase